MNFNLASPLFRGRVRERKKEGEEVEERWGDGKRGRRERGREREGRREDRRRRSKRGRETGTIEGGERKWNVREKGKWEN